MHPAPVAWHVTHWGTDPWSRGSWTSLGVGGSTADRATAGTPVDDRFVLAGDATNPGAPSMTHGAYDEGVRAARWAVAGGARRLAVIGAGFAGLGAARTATDLGADVVVLEARDRIGGRAHTVILGQGVHADAGAAWLQQSPTNSLARLAEHWGLRTVPTDFHHPLAAAADGPVGDVAAAHAALAVHLATAPADATVADVLPEYLAALPPHERRVAQHAVDLELELENPAPPHLLAARTALDEPGVGVGDRWLPAGYTALQQRLADGIDIRLGTPVRGVTWNADGVEVRTASGDVHRVDRCICTIPAWLVPDLELTPGLPAAHLAAIGRLVPGVVEKVVLRFDERWWPVSPSGYLRWYDHPASWGEWLDLTDGVGAPVVAGLIAGTAVSRRHHGDDEAIAVAATAALARWAASIT